MTTPELATELAELAAWLGENVERIPEHRRRQALVTLERVEAMVPPSTPEEASA